MAMVFKSERNLEVPLEGNYNNLGPGEYINLSKKNFSVNKEPFLTSSPRSKFEIKDTPGPGAYYHDENQINYLKNLQSEKISKQNDKTNLLTKGLDGKISKLIFLINTEKKGFNIKSKRFKILDSSGNPPGPGQYFKDKKNVEKNKLKKLKENEIYSNKKFKIIKTSDFQKIPTIPSKENSFGFEVLKNGELIQRQNPELYKTFSGEKGDTVGPGTYEIEKPSNWLKTGTFWSKLSSIRDCNKTDFSNSISTATNFSESKKNNFNNIKSKVSERSKEFNKTKSFELNDNSNINLSKNSTKTNKKTLLNLIVTNCKINNNKKIKTFKTFETVIKKITPGPGYYYNESDTAFKVKHVPELKQFFGSKLSRFVTKRNLAHSLGPGEYFKQEKIPIQMNKTSSSVFAPFSSSIERFNYSEENKDIPGPGDYNPSNLEKIKKISVDGKFGSNELRFYNMYNLNWKNFIPGPGFYDANNDKNLNLNKTNKNFHKKGKIFNSTKIDLERQGNSKINNLVNKKIKEEEVPPLGSYNPEIVNSIDYKVKKKAYESRNNKVAFTSTYDRKKKKKNNIIIDCQESNLGPGYYYHENKKKDIQLSAVFHLPEFKRNIKRNVNPIVGPGKYNLNSYNDWTKKSFNINFV